MSVKRESTVNLDNSNLPEILLSFCAIDVYALRNTAHSIRSRDQESVFSASSGYSDISE